MRARDLLAQVGISLATGFLVSLAVEHWRARRAVAPLPRPPADGADHV